MKERWVAAKGSRLSLLRLQVHHWLDARWKYGSETRDQSYKWLCQRMNIPLRECHIGMFDESECERAIEVLKAGGDYSVLAAQSEMVKKWRCSANGV